MQVITSIQEMQKTSLEIKRTGATIGCVPTMGFFHRGHLSLMEGSRAENDFTVVSLFVNPTQFGENEDFDEYPRDLERDKDLAEKAGVDILFVPAPGEMYPENFSTFVNVYGLTDEMCGASRPGHFRGVTTVVSKLFNIILPNRAYFGQKDAQQALVVQRMVEDLNFPVEIRVMPIIREDDGLAMSSRNTYLSKREREAALVIPKSLEAGRALLEQGEKRAALVAEKISAVIKREPLACIDYLVVKDAVTLKDIEEIKGRVLVAVAVWIGKTRLIDNFIFESPQRRT
ncbi:MAG TPA: pantoate--beta-alanine ligase [Clostridia bacterium]|nr:pantoate--beta-alanine ligase [Clostridia bacterium]